MRIRLDLDQEMTNRLIESAAKERRPVAWQAEVLLKAALSACPKQRAKTAVKASIADKRQVAEINNGRCTDE
jgi:hypothetical protein